MTVDLCQPPVITPTSMHLWQVIQEPTYEGSVTAIAGKSASVSVSLQSSGFLTGLSGAVNVIVQDQNGKTVTQTLTPIPFSAFDASASYMIPPTAFSTWVPASATQLNLSATVIPSSNSIAVGKISANPLQLRVMATSAPTIRFTAVQEADVPIDNHLITAEDPTGSQILNLESSKALLNRAFPFADNSVLYSTSATPIIANDPSNLTAKHSYTFATDPRLKVAAKEDIIKLEKLRHLTAADKLVGVVGSQYFVNHGFAGNVVGQAYPDGFGYSYNSVFVRANATPQVVLHELGHTYGASDRYNEATGVYDGTVIQGYDASTSKIYGASLPGGVPAQSFMGPQTTSSVWSDSTTYSAISSFLLNGPEIDPPTILVTGILSEDGTFTFYDATPLQNGVVSQSVKTGDVALETVDQNGKAISTTQLQSSYNVSVVNDEEGSPTVLDSGSMAVIAQVPNSASLASFNLKQNGKLLASTSFQAQLLSGIVSRIPDHAFRDPRGTDCKKGETYIARDKAALNAWVGIIQSQLKQPVKSVLQKIAIDALLDGLIDTIKLVTYEYYTLDDGSELIQADVIKQLKALEFPLH